MIKIVKGDAPSELLVKGGKLADKLKADFDAHPVEYATGELTFDFTDCYKSKAVVTALKACQYDKCCFSEARFKNGDYRQVEHFRPKGRIDGYGVKLRIYPGYYWLAYDWSNLFMCKQLINVSFKKTHFPLLNEHERNVNHHLAHVEAPLLINPAVDEPRDHIRFHRDEPVHISDRGKLTIKLLGLQHADFEEGRRTHLVMLEAMKNVIDIAVARGMDIEDPMFAKPLALLREAVLPSAEFSSMAIDFLSGWPHL
jgi:hypothetical protein